MYIRLAFVIALSLLAATVRAEDKVKIGFVNTLSGPLAALGLEIRDGFNLALKSKMAKS